MATGDTPNQNLFGTDYNAEEEERKKAELAAQNARMGAGEGTQGSNRQGGFFKPGGFGYEYLGPRLGENIEKFAGEQLYGTGITAEGQATGFPVDRPSLAGNLLTLPGTALNVVGDFVTDPIVAGGKLAKDVADYATGSTGVQAQQDAQAASVASDLGTTPSVTPPVERPTAGAQEQPEPVVSPFLQSPDTPSGLGGPLLRGFEMVNDAARGPNAPMGQDATRAALGGMTLNEYLNAPAGTEGVSGLRTDPQGRMITPSAQPPVDSAVPSATTQPPVDALSSFEQDSLSRQQRIGGTGSFEGDSEARDARVREMDRRPGESQADRDTRVAQSRTQGSRAEGQLSQADLRDLAQGSSRDATAGEKARALEIQQRAGLGEFKPDMTASEQEALRVESADKESFNTSISNSTSPEGVVDYNQALNEYVKGGGSSKGYLEFLRKGQELEQKAKDAERKPEIKVVKIGGFNVLTQDGKYMTATTIGGEELSTSAIRTLQGRIELLGDAEEDYLSGDPERIKRAERTITALDIKNDFGGQLSAKDYFKPDANDNSKTFDPDALTGKDKEAYDFAIDNPNAPQSASILRLLGAN